MQSLEPITKKHILLDTNILISSTNNLKEFADFFKELKHREVVICIDPMIELEFLRNANSPSSLSTQREYLNGLLASDKSISFPITADIFIDARRISNLYHSLPIKKRPELVDCIVASQLKKYRATTVLATLNHKDYPLQLFDRVSTFTIAEGVEPKLIGIYQFSDQKFDRLVSHFEKIKN